MWYTYNVVVKVVPSSTKRNTFIEWITSFGFGGSGTESDVDYQKVW